MHSYWVYILSNQSRCLYTGVTGDLHRRMYQHKNSLFEGHSKRFNIRRLVYFEACSDVRVALQREKQIKGWTRAKRINLVLKTNPSWKDLAKGWFERS